MKEPNENGVYEPEQVEELARRGRSYACVEIAQCTDGLYRFALDAMFSDRGFGGPITDRGTGYPSPVAALDAGTAEMLKRFPKPTATDPQSIRLEISELGA
jgi:hypothetical protein